MRKRNCSVSVRFSDEEYEALLEKVKQSGQTKQSYIITTSLGGKVTTREEIDELKKKNRILEDMDRQLRGMGTNLNQIAYKANSQGIVPGIPILQKMADEVSGLRKEVDDYWQLTRRSISGQTHMEQ